MDKFKRFIRLRRLGIWIAVAAVLIAGVVVKVVTADDVSAGNYLVADGGSSSQSKVSDVWLIVDNTKDHGQLPNTKPPVTNPPSDNNDNKTPDTGGSLIVGGHENLPSTGVANTIGFKTLGLLLVSFAGLMFLFTQQKLQILLWRLFK